MMAAVEGAEVVESLKKKNLSCWPKPKHSFENRMNKICICLESVAQALSLRRVGIKAGDRRDDRGGREGVIHASSPWKPREPRFAV